MVSSYYPVFVGKKPEEMVKVLQQNFQLEVEHHFKESYLEYYVMKDANGNHLDVMRHEEIEEQGMFGIRVNVDNFDAMAELLKGLGYEYTFGPIDIPSAVIAVMENPKSPDKIRYLVSCHKKD